MEHAATKDNKIILVAEDDTTLAHFLRRHLENEGFHPHIVESGEEVLKLAATMQPNVIVLDVGLPGIDGLSVCRQLKQDQRVADIPVLFLTGRDDINDRVNGLDAGGQDYLVKPFAMPEFQARLRAIMRSRDAVEEMTTEIDQRQDEFLAILNHELRAPLTVITMAAQILAENQQVSPDRRDQLIQSIRVSAGTLSHIIDDLLFLTTPTRHLRTCNLRHLVLQAVEEARPRMQEHGLHLAPRVPHEIPALVADEPQLKRTLLHLIDNAIKFTPRGGVITISVSLAQHGQIINAAPGHEQDIIGATPAGLVPDHSDETWAIIAVRDTGIGIAPEHHRRVFEPFYQVDSSTARPAPGLGLGLAVVAAFVRAHHGHLAVRSGNGIGTAIHLALPLRPTADDVNTHARSHPDIPQGA